MSTDVDVVDSAPMTDDERDAMLRQILTVNTAIAEDIAATKALIEKVMTEVEPALEALSNHPMAKMFLRGLGS